MRRLSSIQILRAAAALSVALYHACQWSRLDFGVGAAGVDVFFVISGFVLWSACEARSGAQAQSPAAFLRARAERILPLYWSVTLAVGAAALVWPQALPIVHPETRHLLLSLALVPHADPVGGPFPLLPTGWTLTYEAFFYLAMALALAAPQDRRLQLLCGLVLTASLLGFAYHRWYTLLANPLLLEFLGGVALARLWARGGFGRMRAAFGPGLIGAGVAGLAVCQLSGLRDDFLRPFVWGPPAVLIVAGALKLEADGPVGRGPLARALVAEGDASYSLYLVQAPLIAAFAWLTPAWPAVARAPLAFALAVAGGWAAYRLVERPMSLACRRLHQLPAAHRRGRGGLGLAEQEALPAVDADLA